MLSELRLEADFFGLENLVRIVENEMKATKECVSSSVNSIKAPS